ncbi:MAG TPA: hypothetical protein VM848_18230 [Acidimicrobiia bacterium]|nr:hypothetical protein [Acidimicrobiia bacterium]
MKRRTTLLVLVAVATLVTALPASAGHDDDPRTENLHPMGHIEEPASLFFGPPTVHTDIAFWGKYAFQGNWLGINVRDISAPGNPRQVSFTECEGNQGDVLVWDDVLVRSWNSPAPPGVTCDGQTVPQGFEGLHVFDISNVRDPALIGSVELECGSHTATAVPDPANDRLLVYNSGSSGACEGFEVVEVPLSDPASASQINFVELDRDCHDIGVILGDAMKAACAGDDGFAVVDISGSLTDPTHEYSVSVPGVSIGHSAAFSWDGEVVIFGHEPGGGVASNCEEPNPDSDKSYFFYETATGDLLGTWVLPRPQSATENCTLHNFNVVPIRSGNDVLVHGSYQSGVSVVDFTDPTHPVELAYSDPPPISPPDLGGSWSAYWYNNFIYETNITEGLNIFRFSGNQTAGAIRLDHLNPQTQMFTIDG